MNIQAMMKQAQKLQKDIEDKTTGETDIDDGKPTIQNRGKYNDMVTIQTPQGNFDIKMEKRLTKKTAHYTDMYGVEKTLEIVEEEI